MAVSGLALDAVSNHREIAPQHFCKSMPPVAPDAGILQDVEMDAEFNLDNVDLRILRVLQANGRATYDEVAAEVSLSPSATLRRAARRARSPAQVRQPREPEERAAAGR